MQESYADWIRANVPRFCQGLCGVYTENMADEFPELRRVRGHVECNDGGTYQHWWCVDEGDQVVDPTVRQFNPHGGVYAYRPIDETTFREPTGRCLNCGELSYTASGYSCSDACSAALDSHYNGR